MVKANHALSNSALQTFFAAETCHPEERQPSSQNATRLFVTLSKMALVFGENRPWIELLFLPVPSGKIQVKFKLIIL